MWTWWRDTGRARCWATRSRPRHWWRPTGGGRDRERPLWLGSLKSSTSGMRRRLRGVAGVIKDGCWRWGVVWCRRRCMRRCVVACGLVVGWGGGAAGRRGTGHRWQVGCGGQGCRRVQGERYERACDRGRAAFDAGRLGCGFCGGVGGGWCGAAGAVRPYRRPPSPHKPTAWRPVLAGSDALESAAPSPSAAPTERRAVALAADHRTAQDLLRRLREGLPAPRPPHRYRWWWRSACGVGVPRARDRSGKGWGARLLRVPVFAEALAEC